MSIFQIVAFPLYLIAALEISLGIILVRNNPRKSRVQKAVSALSFLSAAFSFITATMYLRAGLGLSIDLTARLNWIGWFTVPAALQILYYLQDDRGRTGNLVGAVLHPVWLVILGLCLFTEQIVTRGYSVIPFVNHPGPLENPARLFGSLLAVWLLVETVRVKNRLHGIKKAQLNYFFQGLLIFGGGAAFTAGLLQVFGGFGFEPGLASFFSLPWVALTYYAITRYRLFDIRLLVSRVLSILLLVALFSISQIGLITFLTPALGDNLSVLISLGIIGIIFSLTRINRHLQRLVQQLILQDKYDYHAILKESVTAMVTMLKLEELLGYIIASTKNSLGVEHASLILKGKTGELCRIYGHQVPWTDQEDAGKIALKNLLKRSGHAAVREELQEMATPESLAAFRFMEKLQSELILPLLYKGEIKGFMVLGEKGNKDPYFQSDIDLLESLAAHSAVAIENAQLYEEARQAKGSMRESEAKFETLAETAAMGIFIHQGGNFLYANRAGEVIGGYSYEEYMNLDFMSLVHPDFIELVRNRARQRLAGAEAPQQYEFKIVRKNGDERWVLMTAGISEYEGKPAVIGTLIDITERKQAEEEREEYSLQLQQALQSLKESELRFRTLTETTAAGILIDEGGRLVYANPAAEHILGFAQHEYLGMRTMDLIHPDFRQLIRDKTGARELGLPVPTEYEIKMLNKKSEERFMNVSIGAIQFGGRPSTIVTLFDITERKEAEEERHQMSLLVESSSDFIGMATLEGKIIFVNSAGRKLVGLPAGHDIKQMSLLDFFMQQDLPVFEGQLLPNDAWRGEFRLRHCQTGLPIPVEMYGFTVFDRKTGKPMARAAVMHDITDLKRAREERERYFQQLQETTQSLRESEEKFRTLAETTTAAIFIHQGQKLVYANAAAAMMTGYTSEELLQEDFWSLIHPDYQGLVKERGMARLKGEKLPRDYEYKFIKKNGDECWVSMTAGFIEYGSRPAIIATLFDITDWKRAEEAKVKFYEESVRQYQERIGEEKRHRLEKEKILMDLHDGIGGITTNISILSELARKARDHESAVKLLSTISGLSREGIAEIRGFMHSLDSKELNWRTLASELRSQGTNMIENHSMAFSIDTDVQDITEQPGSLTWVNIFKIYKEALTNVIKHSRASEVRVRFQVHHDEAVLSIQDNGVGVNSDGNGGRGLSHMRTRAEDIGGSVIVSNRSGTNVSLLLPLPLKYPAGGMAIRR